MEEHNVSETLPPEVALQGLLSGVLLTQMVAVAARLGIADLLVDGPRHHAEIAADLDVSPPALYRMLRSLAGHGVFAEDDANPGVFHSTPVGNLLRTDIPGSQRSWAMVHGAEWLWRAIGHMPHSIRTGGPAFPDLFGMGSFAYFSKEPQHGELFFAAMNQVTEMLLPELLKSYDFSPYRHVIDVGGGLGSLVTAVLLEHPHLKGTLYDLPYMQEPASQYLSGMGVGDRCRFVSGDFFESVPEGADLHILKWIIHDWNDEQAVQILGNCRRAIEPDGRLVLVEQVLADGNVPCHGKIMDMIMLVMEQGRERREAEYAALFAASGFRLNRCIPLLGPWCAIEAVPV